MNYWLQLVPSTNIKLYVGDYMRAGILGAGKYVPEKILTNFDLEKILDTSDEWITTRTGISERRIAEDDMNTSHMAINASIAALQDANLSADEIDFIIVATATSDYSFPSTACLVQEGIGAKRAVAMDISAACTGFVYGIATASAFIESGQYRNILVIGADKLTKIVDWEDRNTAVLFGDGAGAFVLGPVDGDKGILASDLGSDGSGAMHLYHDKHIKMNGREVFKFAVRQMEQSCLTVLEKADMKKEEISLLIPHQANIRIMEAIADRLDLPKEKMACTIASYGNTSSSTIPIAYVDEREKGKVKPGDIIVLTGFGGGFTWGANIIKL